MNEVPHPGFEPAKKYETFTTPNNYICEYGFNFADKMTFCGTVDGEQKIVEYIRKDALLEWAKGKMTIEEATEGIVGGYDFALKDVIKHIESL